MKERNSNCVWMVQLYLKHVELWKWTKRNFSPPRWWTYLSKKHSKILTVASRHLCAKWCCDDVERAERWSVSVKGVKRQRAWWAWVWDLCEAWITLRGGATTWSKLRNDSRGERRRCAAVRSWEMDMEKRDMKIGEEWERGELKKRGKENKIWGKMGKIWVGF